MAFPRNLSPLGSIVNLGIYILNFRGKTGEADHDNGKGTKGEKDDKGDSGKGSASAQDWSFNTRRVSCFHSDENAYSWQSLQDCPT